MRQLVHSLSGDDNLVPFHLWCGQIVLKVKKSTNVLSKTVAFEILYFQSYLATTSSAEDILDTMLVEAKTMKWCICHCMRSVRIRSFSGPYFAAFGLNTESISPYSVGMRENADQKNPEYGYFSRSVFHDCSKGTGTGHFYCAKSVQIRSFSGPQFPIFGLNTEIYIQSKYGKIQIRKIPCLETFCAVFNVYAPTIPKFPNYFLLQINHMPAGWSSIMTIY